MENISMSDWIAIGISVLAFAFSLFSFIRSSALIKGQVEMQIREMISSARWRFSDLSIQLADEENNTTLAASTMAALEDVLNAYDEACAKYIDNKVDRERFKKLYTNEIRNLVEDENTKKYYVMPQSRFQATVKVYREWNNLE